MATINSSSLFHFTGTKNVLFKILSTGLRFSYCYESFGNTKGMAIPMICFCDIPLMRSYKHRNKYGNYAIGFNKDYMLKTPLNLNPIQYITSIFGTLGREVYSKTIIQSLKSGFSAKLDEAMKQSQVPISEIEKKGYSIFGEDSHYKLESLSIARLLYWYQLVYTRPYMERINGKEVINYDEQEWRAVSHYNRSDDDSINWIEEITNDEFLASKSTFANTIITSSQSHITIPSKDINKAISVIIVKNEKMVSDLIRYILKSKTLLGAKNILENDRLLLISKITSFERIERDY